MTESSEETSTDDDFDLQPHFHLPQPLPPNTIEQQSDEGTIPYDTLDSEEELFVPEAKEKRARKTPARLADYVME